jgi:hypothetical protein
LASAPVASNLALNAGSWSSADVTSVVTANGPLDLALAVNDESTIERRFASREAVDAAPRLVVETDLAAPPPTDAPLPPLNVIAPTISGDAREGESLAAAEGVWLGAPTRYDFDWRRCDPAGTGCVAVAPASRTYVVGPDDVGSVLSVVVRATNAGGTASAVSAPTPVVTGSAGASCARPYAGDSPWNTPIASSPAIDPSSVQYVQYLLSNPDQNVLTSDPTQYSFPVFTVNAATPVRTVRFNVANVFGYGSGTYSNVYGGGSDAAGNMTVTQASWRVEIPIPADAASANGSDGQAIVVNPATGDEWAFWQLLPDPVSPGNFVATNGYHYNTNWSGVPPKGFGSRGPGMTYLAGLIRPCEIMQGHIDHAIAFAFRSPASTWVYPATKSDGGKFGDAFPELAGVTKRLPEGARLQLDPSLSDDVLGPLKDRQGRACSTRDSVGAWQLTPCLVIAHALQQYGMIVADHSGRAKIYAEYSDCGITCTGWTAHWGQNVNATAVPALDQYTANPIPVAELRVIETGPLSP